MADDHPCALRFKHTSKLRTPSLLTMELCTSANDKDFRSGTASDCQTTNTGKISPFSCLNYYYVLLLYIIILHFILCSIFLCSYLNFIPDSNKTMRSQSSSSVILHFSGPEKKGGHYVYSLVGTDKNGEFNTVRRYSDFSNLRSTLQAKWPGFYIPTLPEKKFLGTEDSTFIEIRKNGLSYFIHTLKFIQHLWYTQETQLFLRKIGDPEKELQKMKDTGLNQILQRYKQQFSELFNQQIPKELNNQIIDFGQYLKKARGLLQNLQKMTEQIFNSRKKFNQKYLNLLQTVIPDYETNCMQVYRNENNFEELIFTGSKREKIVPYYEEFRLKMNSVLAVIEEIRREKQQIIGFEDILKTKEYYSIQKQKSIIKIKDLEIQTTKIHSGKQSLMSKIKGKSKEQQLKDNQASINKAQHEQKNLAIFCEVITLLLGQTQIKKFKAIRQRSYYSLLKKMFELEKQENRLKKQFWSLVLKENHEKEELENFFDHSPAKESDKKPYTTEAQSEEYKSKLQEEQNGHQQLQEETDEEPQQVQISSLEGQSQVQQIKSYNDDGKGQKYEIQ